MLHAIRVRYSRSNIYTYSGIVLIAANPFQKLDNLYSPDIIQAYAGRTRGELEPHLFAISEDAFRCMVRDKKNQTVVVSGESGAGKTVSAKFIMRYFATVEDADAQDTGIMNQPAESMSQTEEQILATNPIMEAFGNAKTTRNDNSSRFGKYLEILFDKKRNIIGAEIRTYLLERSRLVFQPKTERNYHIFYQLCAGADEKMREKIGLLPAEEYFYLNQGGEIKIDRVDDKEEFEITRDALSLIGMSEEKQIYIFEILSGLLRLGNIEIVATRNDAHLASDEPNLLKACEMLGVSATDFAKWIVKKQITTRSEKIISSLNHTQAVVSRDSVAKYIYSCIFDWLVDFINSDLCPESLQDDVASFIGVLDIFGFEHFEKNSFEQFCINYANEKLQQEFNQHVFKLEQEEYIREELEWKFIEFTDNQPCIDLIESKLGILSLLDEESRLPSGSDESWMTKLYQSLDKPPHNKVFKKPRFGNNKFIVAHYAIDVAYDSEGFIEKNRDTVSDGHLEALKATTNPLLKEVFASVEAAQAKVAAAAPAKGGRRMVHRKPTLGSIFKASLIDLMKIINSTNVHYIRCIKPNEEKVAWKFDSLMVLSQLRACGVLETIRISCVGFPTRWTYEEFASRYYMLIPSSEWVPTDINEFCSRVLTSTIEDNKKYQTGNTKIFFKAGMLAFLEKKRSDRLHSCAVLIQKNLRMLLYRNRYREIRKSIINSQALLRGHRIRANFRKEVERRAATSIQSLVRGYLIRKMYADANASTIIFQAISRGRLIRAKLVRIRQTEAAVVIQTWWRGKHQRQEYLKSRKAIIYTQSCFRRRFAIRELQQLKVESKSAEHFKEVSYQLENKVVELTQNLAGRNSENKKLKAQIERLEKMAQQSKTARGDLLEREKEYEEDSKKVRDEYQTKIKTLEAAIAAVEDDKQEALTTVEKIKSQYADLESKIKEKDEEFAKAQDTINGHLEKEASLNTRIDDLKAEIGNLRSDNARLEQISKSAQISIDNIGAPKIRKNQPIQNRRSLSPAPGKWSSPTNNVSDKNRPMSVAFPVSQRESLANSVDTGSATLYNQYEDDSASDIDFDFELAELLQDSKHLHKEVVDGLVKNLKIPAPSIAVNLLAKEVMFPARIIIIIISDMWRLGLVKESERFLSEVFQAIQQYIISYKDDDIAAVGTFWLSNVHEMLSFVTHAHAMIVESENLIQIMGESEYNEYLNLAVVVKEDFESLGYNIYHTWLKKMKKALDKIAVPAVVVSQSLPGFITNDASPFLSKMFSSAPLYNMDDVLTFFNSLEQAQLAYCLEPEVMNGAILELLRYIDVLCFNDLLMRRNFLSWKRGLQLNYNVTRLEEWCKSHGLDQGSFLLVHLFQVAKLLQLKKASNEDIEIIYDICYALKPSQIQKLLTQYYVADYEPPISQDILQAIAQKVRESSASGQGDDKLFEDVNASDPGDPFENVEVRQFSKIEAYVPSWLHVPTIKRIAELVAANAEKTELRDLEDMAKEQNNLEMERIPVA